MVQKRAWIIGLDADDTLWHNEKFFHISAKTFAEMLSDYAETAHLAERLLDVERRNLARYGYGIKGYVLSMIETAIDVTDGQVPTSVISELLGMGHDMLAHPIDLMPQVQETLETLAQTARLVLITKGDLLHQEQKLARSGLGDFFDAVEIVSEKTPAVYGRIFAKFDGDHHLMAGDSLKSDVIPAIEAGAWGVHVPHGTPWALDHAPPPLGHPRFRTVEEFGRLPQLIESLP